MISISSAFNAFREELDDHHDRRERLIKVVSSPGYAAITVLRSFCKSHCISSSGQQRHNESLQKDNIPAASPGTRIAR